MDQQSKERMREIETMGTAPIVVPKRGPHSDPQSDVSLSKKAGIGRQTAYDLRQRDEDFRAEWDSTIDAVDDAADAELYRRGIEGSVAPVFHKGINVGETVKTDTLALIAWLNAHGKARGYGRQEVKLSGDPDAPLEMTTIITDRKRPTMADLKNGQRKNGVPAK